MFKEKKEPRLVVVSDEKINSSYYSLILADTETGVQYLFVAAVGDKGGLTIMLDENGKPLINKKYKRTLE